MKRKRMTRWLMLLTAVLGTVMSGGTYILADTPALTDRVEGMAGGGKRVTGADNPAGGQWHGDSRQVVEDLNKDFDYYQKEINRTICEMKLESCPIDQILRASQRTQKAQSMIIKYYAIGTRSIKTTLKEKVNATQTGMGTEIKPVDAKAFDSMDTILFPAVKGYKADGTTRDTRPLMVRVVNRSQTGYPIVVAVNGKKSAENCFDLPDLPAGTPMLRLGRAAGERDVNTGSYYTLPEPSEQYCQRFIMQVEQSKIEQMLKTVVDWNFLKQERVAMDDMRNGIERTGLFGIKGHLSWTTSGEIYTTDGIWWKAGKDLELGHWQPKMAMNADGTKTPMTAQVEEPDTVNGGTKKVEKTVYEYVIDKKELVRFVDAVIKDAGNGSRTKLLFVDNLIYQALSTIKTDNRIIFATEKNYENWNLDFESFSSMGTKILVYRHDAFNYMGFDGCAFCLDPRYLDKWVFGDWTRKQYDLNNLFLRNSDAVVMTEYSCWTLQFPKAHARVTRPEFTEDGITDEIQVA